VAETCCRINKKEKLKVALKTLYLVYMKTIKKNTETILNSNKEVGLEVNTEKTKYMLLSHHQNAGQNHDIKNIHSQKNNMDEENYIQKNNRTYKEEPGRHTRNASYKKVN
jgi:hypothetical protein